MERVIIRIKMPPAAGSNEVRFDCSICQKSFRSGKGLGGHKRVHMMQLKQQAMAEESTTHDTDELQEKNQLVCPICPQSFASKKSLYGHMRKHPDRNWRGMRPPPPPPPAKLENGNSFSSKPPVVLSDAVALGVPVVLTNNSDDDDKKLVVASSTDLMSSGRAMKRRRGIRHGKAPMDLTTTPPGTTGRRGIRHGEAPTEMTNNIPPDDHDDKESMLVAYDLMALSNDEQPKPKKQKLDIKILDSGFASSLSKNNKAIVLGGGLENVNKLSNPAGPEEEQENSIKKSLMIVDNGDEAHKIPIMRDKRKYVCKICKKPFRSYHAMAGHKSHHIALKISDEESATAAAASGSQVPNMDQPPEIANGNQSTVFSFDLNELPEPEDDGGN